jgi:hypothetical protein
MLYIGIDYSITSPSICTFYGDKKSFDPRMCNFFYYNKTKQISPLEFVHQTTPPENYKSPINRFTLIANWTIRCIDITKQAYDYPETMIIIEDYSFGSKGKIFELAENCGIMKYMLEVENYKYQKIAPTTLKKYATSSGRSNKDDMYDKFFEETQLKLKETFSKKKIKISSPVSDLVDSYYLCKYLVFPPE